MEIKICCLVPENGVYEMHGDQYVQSGVTYVFEGMDIQYSFMHFLTREMFVKMIGEDYTRALGMPEWFYNEEKQSNPGYYVRLTFTDTEQWRCLIIKNSTVYITNNGRTVDKIEIR